MRSPYKPPITQQQIDELPPWERRTPPPRHWWQGRDYPIEIAILLAVLLLGFMIGLATGMVIR